MTVAALEFEQSKDCWNLWFAKRLPQRNFRAEMELATLAHSWHAPALLVRAPWAEYPS